MGDQLQTYKSPTQDQKTFFFYYLGEQKLILPQVFVKLYPLVQDLFFFEYYTVKQEGYVGD